MFSMLHPGWLLLLICTVILFLVGCSVLPTRTPAPSATSPLNVTLTVYPLLTDSPFPYPTRSSAATPQYALLATPGFRRTPSPPPEEDLYVEMPLCISAYQGSICLGRVWNRGTVAANDILLRVLLSEDGEILERFYAPEQRLIPAGSFAPYRFSYTSGQLEAVEIASILPYLPENLVALTIIDERGILHDDGRYIITSSLQNDTGKPLSSIRAVAAVVDEWEQVVGYRVFDYQERLNVGERTMIRLEIIPQVGGIVHHYLHAEGQQAH